MEPNLEENKTLPQKRAKHAWNAISVARDELGDSEKTSEYQRQAKRMPVDILNSGLGHTVAFMLANNNKIRERIVDDLADWLLGKLKLGGDHSKPKGKNILEEIIERDSNFLRRISEESLLYLEWLTRFADAEFKRENGEEE